MDGVSDFAARRTSHDAVDVAGELGVGDAQPLLARLEDGLERPARIEFGGDVGELSHEGDATRSLHAFGGGRGAHPNSESNDAPRLADEYDVLDSRMRDHM